MHGRTLSRSDFPPGITGDNMLLMSLAQQARLARERRLLLPYHLAYALTSHPHASQAAPQNILLVERLLRWGDSIVAQPARQLIRKLHPQARITSLCLPFSAPIVARDSGVDVVLARSSSQPPRQGRILHELRKMKFDCAYVLVSDAVSLMLPWRLGIPQSHGYNYEQRGFALTHTQPMHPSCNKPAWFIPEGSDVPHITRIWADMVSAGAPIQPPVITLTAEERERGEQLWAFAPVDVPRIIIHPCASSPNYTWQPARWRALGELLEQRLGKLAVVVTGSSAERREAEETARGWRFPHRILAGELDFAGLAGLVAAAKLTCAPDTSIGHIAAALGVPSVVLFGPGDPRLWRPAGSSIIMRNDSPCRGCKRKECGQPFVMCTALTTVESFAGAVDSALAGKAQSIGEL